MAQLQDKKPWQQTQTMFQLATLVKQANDSTSWKKDPRTALDPFDSLPLKMSVGSKWLLTYCKFR